jgi:hypothetical protein
VCTSWRRLALDEPLLWRHIDLPAEEDEDGHPPARWKARACAAVRCSAGRCESYRGRVNRDFLLFLARKYVRVHQSPLLTHLSSTPVVNPLILIAIAFLCVPCCAGLLQRAVAAEPPRDEPV